jgi:hypothetical protein
VASAGPSSVPSLKLWNPHHQEVLPSLRLNSIQLEASSREQAPQEQGWMLSPPSLLHPDTLLPMQQLLAPAGLSAGHCWMDPRHQPAPADTHKTSSSKVAADPLGFWACKHPQALPVQFSPARRARVEGADGTIWRGMEDILLVAGGGGQRSIQAAGAGQGKQAGCSSRKDVSVCGVGLDVTVAAGGKAEKATRPDEYEVGGLLHPDTLLPMAHFGQSLVRVEGGQAHII